MLQTAGSEVLRFILLVLIAGNLLALAVGALLALVPRKAQGWFRHGDRWISTRQLTKPLDVMRNADSTMLRYPRALGAILLAGALYILIKGSFFIAGLSVAEGGQLLARLFADTPRPTPLWEALWVALIALILLGALLALTVGAAAVLKAETLRSWSGLANRWLSTRRALKPLEQPYYGLDRLVNERPRVFGAVIATLALYSLIVLFWFARGV